MASSSFSNNKLREILESKEGKTYTVFGVTAGIIAFMFFFAIRPAWISISDKLAENADKREYIAAANDKLDRLLLLSTDASTYATSIGYLDQFFLPEEIQESFVVNNMTEYSKAHNLEIRSMNIEEPEDFPTNFEPSSPGSSKSVKGSINLIGKIIDLNRFIKTLESSGKIIHIESVSTRISDDGDEVITSNAERLWHMNIVFYFFYWET